MDDFVEKIKQGAAKVFDEAEKVTNAAVNKTGSVLNQTRVGYAINASEAKIKALCAEIGNFVYDEYKRGNEFPEDINERLKKIDSLYEEINELKLKLADLKNSKICPSCNAFNDNENTYCAKCGEKIN